MKKNVGFIVGIIMLMAFVWALTALGRNVFFKKEKSAIISPTLAIELTLC